RPAPAPPFPCPPLFRPAVASTSYTGSVGGLSPRGRISRSWLPSTGKKGVERNNVGYASINCANGVKQSLTPGPHFCHRLSMWSRSEEHTSELQSRENLV